MMVYVPYPRDTANVWVRINEPERDADGASKIENGAARGESICNLFLRR
jgi:hypothetical protein